MDKKYQRKSFYYENESKLKAVPIVNPATGKAVLPAPEHVISGDYAPLSRPLFIYVNASSASRPEVRSFMEFFFEHARGLIDDVHYLPLSEAAYSMAARNFRNRKYGTVFDGEPERDLAVEEILARAVKR